MGWCRLDRRQLGGRSLDDRRPRRRTQRFIESAEAKRKAGRPAANVIASELEAFRIDIMRGRIAEALPQVERRLGQVEALWQQYRSGDRLSEVPDPEFLARALTCALDVAMNADIAQKDWVQALRRVDAILELNRSLKRQEDEIARYRLNRALVLKNLGRFGQAKSELEDCLQVFRNDAARRAATLSFLAELFAAQGDVREAIIQERRPWHCASNCPIRWTAPARTATSPFFFRVAAPRLCWLNHSATTWPTLYIVSSPGWGSPHETRCTTTPSTSVAHGPPIPSWPCREWPNYWLTPRFDR